mmetsp:Transcript_8351/g.21527  ORF Transcript_8351/g.21527 Transcript_8351/m.21527 type:complete len:127 (-) Transcript_8351:213-593(-)
MASAFISSLGSGFSSLGSGIVACIGVSTGAVAAVGAPVLIAGAVGGAACCMGTVAAYESGCCGEIKATDADEAPKVKKRAGRRPVRARRGARRPLKGETDEPLVSKKKKGKPASAVQPNPLVQQTA